MNKMACCPMIHSLLNEPIEMPARRLVQQTSLLATTSLPLISLLLLIKCFVHSQLFGCSYLNHTNSVASGLEACPPSLVCQAHSRGTWRAAFARGSAALTAGGFCG